MDVCVCLYKLCHTQYNSMSENAKRSYIKMYKSLNYISQSLASNCDSSNGKDVSSGGSGDGAAASSGGSRGGSGLII